MLIQIRSLRSSETSRFAIAPATCVESRNYIPVDRFRGRGTSVHPARRYGEQPYQSGPLMNYHNLAAVVSSVSQKPDSQKRVEVKPLFPDLNNLNAVRHVKALVLTTLSGVG